MIQLSIGDPERADVLQMEIVSMTIFCIDAILWIEIVSMTLLETLGA